MSASCMCVPGRGGEYTKFFLYFFIIIIFFFFLLTQVSATGHLLSLSVCHPWGASGCLLLHDACHLCLLVTVDACQFSVLVTSTHLSPQDTLSLMHICSGHMLPLDNFNLPLYSTQEIFWYCRDCPGFEPGTTGFVAWRSTTEPPQPHELPP